MDGVRIRMFALFWHEGEVWAREIYTLDYGFSSAVLGFNRCAAATAFILQNLLLLPVDHYVDDFWVLVPETLLSCARFCMREGLVALGWRTAAEKSLWGCAVPLVGFLLSAANKSIRVENTEARKHEIVTEIDQVVRSAELQETPLEVLTKVVFRIAFAAQALQGRSGRHALRPLFKCLRPHWPVALHGRLPPDGEQALCLWRDWIQHAEPRSWPIHLHVREIVCLLTDASLKWNRIGGLLITSSGRWAFSAELPQDFIRAHAHTEHYVYAAELYAHMSALATWGASMRGQLLFSFLDNAGAVAALIKGYSKKSLPAEMIGWAWRSYVAADVWPWTEWVHTSSNPADAFTREDWQGAADRFHASWSAAILPSIQEMQVTSV